MTNKPTSDNKLFEVLIREHHRSLLAYAQSLVKNNSTAEDLVQEALLTAYKKLDSFDSDASFPAWVRGIIRFKYLEFLRSSKEVPLQQDVLDSLEATHCEWDNPDTKTQVFSSLANCLAELPEALHSAVYLFYMKKLPGNKVAERLKSNEDTIRKRLQRARLQLGRCIRMHLK